MNRLLQIFLKKYLPKKLDVSSGILVNANGAQTKHLDIIISDADKTPILFEKANVRVIPVECVYAIIEVKPS